MVAAISTVSVDANVSMRCNTCTCGVITATYNVCELKINVCARVAISVNCCIITGHEFFITQCESWGVNHSNDQH